MFLKHSDYVPQGTALNAGESIRLFHCRTGHDNDKLYVTKQRDGSVVAFCHHCGAKGKFIADRSNQSIESVIEEAEAYVNSNVEYGYIKEEEYSGHLPKSIDYKWGNWHPLAKSWVFKYGLTSKEVLEHQIGYDEKMRRVILPIRTKLGTLQGYVSRKVFTDGSDKYPKYLIYKTKDCQIYKQISSPKGTNPFICTITEDVLSAIKCARFTDAFAILGVNLPDRLLKDLRFYHKVLIFLDNDNDIVRSKQVDMAQKILQFTDNCSIIEGKKDPKEHSDDELRRMLV